MKKLLCLLLLLLLGHVFLQAETVRVLLADKQKTDKVQTSGKVYIYEDGSRKKYKISRPETLDLVALGKGKIRVGSLSSSKTIFIRPATGTLLTFEKNKYTGTLSIIPAGNTFHVVEHADLENYLYGVLPYEMSWSWHIEALKAQAVAARTYTLKSIENTKKANFDLFNDVRSQMYKGAGKMYASVKEAVDATKGQVLTYDDKLFYTFYHANCGGGSDDVKHWNKASFSIKPLQGAKCNTDSTSTNYSWKATFARSALTSFANKNGLAGTVKSVKVYDKTKTGRAITLQFKTSKGSKVLSCAKFRMSVGSTKLKSCKIKDIDAGNNFTFVGTGYGHGSGLCQDGAHGMAKDGKDYKKILSQYYPGSKLTTI